MCCCCVHCKCVHWEQCAVLMWPMIGGRGRVYTWTAGKVCICVCHTHCRYVLVQCICVCHTHCRYVIVQCICVCHTHCRYMLVQCISVCHTHCGYVIVLCICHAHCYDHLISIILSDVQCDYCLLTSTIKGHSETLLCSSNACNGDESLWLHCVSVVHKVCILLY